MDLMEINKTINVNIPIRFTYKQKVKASQVLSRFFEPQQFKVFEAAYQREKLHNVLINDIATSKVVLVVSYDTPARFSKAYRYYPFDLQKEQEAQRQQVLRQGAVSFVLGLIALSLFWWRTALPPVLFTSLLAMALLGSTFVFQVRANRNNANRNNGALAIALKLAHEDPSIAVLLLDKTVQSSVGYHLATELFEELKSLPIIILDALTSHPHLVGQTNNRSLFKGDFKINEHLPFTRTLKLARVDDLKHLSSSQTPSSVEVSESYLLDSYRQVVEILQDIVHD